MSAQPWTEGHPDGPRLDVDGVAWFACDPYPTWYRREGDRLITGVRPKFPEEKEEAVTTEGTDTWPPLTEEQEKRLGEWLAALEKLFGMPIHRHHLAWTVEPEYRAGRGYDVQVVCVDGDHVACMGMDPYGNGYEMVGEVDILHNSDDDEGAETTTEWFASGAHSRGVDPPANPYEGRRR